jgi:molybdopterin-containing oxidoreductase family membrane subunit
MVHPLRENMRFLNIACVLAFIGIWIEKGMGLVIPGFIPTPLGEIAEYAPSLTEIVISVGIWAFGLMVFTMLAKMAIPIELEYRRRAPSVTEKSQVASAPGALPVEGS